MGTACLYSLVAYLQGTVCHSCKIRFQTYLMGTVGQETASFYGFWTYLEMRFIAYRAVFILAIYNASKRCFSPFVSDIGNSNWFRYQISDYISRLLLARGATCIFGFTTYFLGTTVCQAAAC